ncbi:type II secretion system protein GspC [Thiomicrorhabdus indica]|uniref:type II secretion system protein GspC n=1 Tax=Thiomicrorhabdus indica TaxID=2267253 RepID=UPI002AA73BEE|nr:type II secretion system protein GspC [Thiomicrorhabdus indica]
MSRLNINAVQMIRWFNVGLVFVLVWLAVKISMQLWQSQSEDFSLSVPQLEKSLMSETSQMQSLQGTLFGKQVMVSADGVVNAKPIVEQGDLKKTRLKLTLKGTLVTPNRQVAIIQKGSQTLVLAIGEEIENNVTVHSVFGSYVVIDNQGAMEKLTLPEVKINSQSLSSNSSKGLTQNQKLKLDNLRQKLKTSPIAINRYVRVRTIQKNGKIQALQLWPRSEKAIFEALGFRSGDRLTAVNGQSVTELASDMSKWQSMMKLSQAQFTVNRNGSLQTIDVNLQ